MGALSVWGVLVERRALTQKVVQSFVGQHCAGASSQPVNITKPLCGQAGLLEPHQKRQLVRVILALFQAACLYRVERDIVQEVLLNRGLRWWCCRCSACTSEQNELAEVSTLAASGTEASRWDGLQEIQ